MLLPNLEIGFIAILSVHCRRSDGGILPNQVRARTREKRNLTRLLTKTLHFVYFTIFTVYFILLDVCILIFLTTESFQ